MWFRSTLWSKKASARSRYFRPQVQALEDRCLLSAGALDPTFGNGAGYVTTSLSNGNDQGKQVLVQPSGNIVVAGITTVPVTTTTRHGTTTTNEDVFGVATYNPDGSLDTAFGAGGIVKQEFTGSAGGGLDAAALEPTGTAGDSKILLAGHDYAQTGMALMRLNANGSLDTTFGNNGQVVTYFPESSNSEELAQRIAVTSSGQILVVGQIGASNTILLARYNPNGSLDTTFGNGGTATTVLASSASNFGIAVAGMALQPDGKFVVVGNEHWRGTIGGATATLGQGLVLRYNANGSLDTTFGNGGVITTAVPPGSTTWATYGGVTVYPNAGTANDGKIVSVGHVEFYNSTGAGYTASTEWLATRYNPNGTLDTTFGNGAGYVVIENPQYTPPYQYAFAAALESDGKVILAGSVSSTTSAPAYSQVARLNGDGSLDAAFGNGGLVTTALGNMSQSRFTAVAIQPDGKILAAGFADVGSQSDWSLARYLPSEPQIGSFNASSNSVSAGSSETLTASNITDGNPNSTITQVTFYYFDSGGNQVTLGTATQTSPGVWTLTFTVNLAPGGYTLFAQAEDSYGVFGDPILAALQVN
jgi:uncharacterized delta-60 repeat protein